MTHAVVWSDLIFHVIILSRSTVNTPMAVAYVVVYLLSNVGTFILLPCETAEATVRDDH